MSRLAHFSQINLDICLPLTNSPGILIRWIQIASSRGHLNSPNQTVVFMCTDTCRSPKHRTKSPMWAVVIASAVSSPLSNRHLPVWCNIIRVTIWSALVKSEKHFPQRNWILSESALRCPKNQRERTNLAEGKNTVIQSSVADHLSLNYLKFHQLQLVRTQFFFFRFFVNFG